MQEGMKMKYLAITVLFMLILSTKSRAFDTWTSTDTILEITSETVIAMDWVQTLQIKDHPDLNETNIFLGSHPSDDKINLYIGSVMILHPLITYILPAKLRPVFQMITIGIEGNAVQNNLRAGLNVKF
jgi:hypothetical protein